MMKTAEHTLSVTKLAEREKQIEQSIQEIKRNETDVQKQMMDPVVQEGVEVLSDTIIRPVLAYTKKEELDKTLADRLGLSVMDKTMKKTLLPELDKHGIVVYENKPKNTTQQPADLGLTKDIMPINAPKFKGGNCKVMLYQYGNLLGIALRTDHNNYFGVATNILERGTQTMYQMKQAAENNKDVNEQQMMLYLGQNQQKGIDNSPAPTPSNWAPRLNLDKE